MSDDIADLVDSERYREILEQKRRVIDTRDEIDRAVVQGRRRGGRMIGLYQRKVRDYVMSVETLLNPHDEEPSRYWTRVPIGDFSLPNGEHRHIEGLDEFLELPTVFELQVETTEKQSYRHRAETVTETRRVRPPEEVIERAFRVTNQALNSIGFDLDEPTDHQKSGFSKVDDVEKGTKIWAFLQQLDEDALNEVKRQIDTKLLGQPDERTNGHHEQS